jgi:hypothetical protein
MLLLHMALILSSYVITIVIVQIFLLIVHMIYEDFIS